MHDRRRRWRRRRATAAARGGGEGSGSRKAPDGEAHTLCERPGRGVRVRHPCWLRMVFVYYSHRPRCWEEASGTRPIRRLGWAGPGGDGQAQGAAACRRTGSRTRRSSHRLGELFGVNALARHRRHAVLALQPRARSCDEIVELMRATAERYSPELADRHVGRGRVGDPPRAAAAVRRAPQRHPAHRRQDHHRPARDRELRQSRDNCTRRLSRRRGARGRRDPRLVRALFYHPPARTRSRQPAGPTETLGAYCSR